MYHSFILLMSMFLVFYTLWLVGILAKLSVRAMIKPINNKNKTNERNFLNTKYYFSVTIVGRVWHLSAKLYGQYNSILLSIYTPLSRSETSSYDNATIRYQLINSCMCHIKRIDLYYGERKLEKENCSRNWKIHFPIFLNIFFCIKMSLDTYIQKNSIYSFGNRSRYSRTRIPSRKFVRASN